MQFWLVCFLVVLGAAEVVPWVMGGTTPSVVLWAVGLLLAIASNADKLPPHLQFKSRPESPALKAKHPPHQATAQNKTSPPQRPSPDLPNFTPPKAPQPSISFTIKKPGASN
ncbi:MAG TPA: hypothetical protein IGS37_10240 [Synechococcales cyanobacterium M55_K2018_004]|nr:hypothetical protein [Synechococcales cyanobacterium M55_K2018_004]